MKKYIYSYFIFVFFILSFLLTSSGGTIYKIIANDRNESIELLNSMFDDFKDNPKFNLIYKVDGKYKYKESIKDISCRLLDDLGNDKKN